MSASSEKFELAADDLDSSLERVTASIDSIDNRHEQCFAQCFTVYLWGSRLLPSGSLTSGFPKPKFEIQGLQI